MYSQEIGLIRSKAGAMNRLDTKCPHELSKREPNMLGQVQNSSSAEAGNKSFAKTT
jgi:hypothetical protein